MKEIILRSYWLVLLCLTFTFFECGTAGKKSIPPELKDKIVFLCSDGICTINPDGTGLKVIVPVENGGPFSDVRWSSDKRRIGFTGQVEGSKRVFLADSDGSHRKILGLPGHSVQFLGWSPSGKYVLYRYMNIIDGSAFGVMSIKGKTIARFRGSYPSLGGKDLLVYAASYGSVISLGSDVLTYDLQSKEELNLTNTHGKRLVIYYPVVSLGGTMIAFQLQGPGVKTDLWAMRSDGSRKRKLATAGEDFPGRGVRALSFSPDGGELMFLAGEEGRAQVFIMNPDGTGLRAVTDEVVTPNGGAAWSPDGRRVVFTSDKDGNDELYIVNADSSGLRRLTDNATTDCCPDW